MKKLLGLTVAFGSMFALAACKNNAEEAAYNCPTTGTGSVKLALITDIGDVTDGSFNQSAWEGVVKYAEANQLTKDTHYKYIKPKTSGEADLIEAIETAIKGGAETIVAPGFVFSDAIGRVQKSCSSTKFLLLDAEATGGNEANVSSVFFAEQESGYLAGYAAVLDGHTKLGFLGGMAIPPVERFGQGFIEGVKDAAAKLSKKVDGENPDITLEYEFTGGFESTPTTKAQIETLFTKVDVLFVAAGPVGTQAAEVAKAQNGAGKSKFIIGVDTDQASGFAASKATEDLAEFVLTSAEKKLTNATFDKLNELKDNNKTWKTRYQTFNLTNDGVGIPAKANNNFAAGDATYDALIAMIKADLITDYNEPDKVATYKKFVAEYFGYVGTDSYSIPAWVKGIFK